MGDGKTIKQIADEIGVTKQSIQKRIAREPLCTCIQPYIDKVGGTKYIAYTGEMLVKQAFLNGDCIHDTDEQTSNVYTSSIPADDDKNELYTMLKKELDMKNEQIRELNARLAESNAALVAAQQTAQAAQALHAGLIQLEFQDGKKQDMMHGFADPSESETKPNKKNLFSRLFGKEG